MPTVPDILAALRAGAIELPPLQVRMAEPGVPGPDGGGRTRRDAPVDVVWGDRVERFMAELVAEATPKALRDAAARARDSAAAAGRRPMVLTSFLAPERLDELEAAEVGGVDLSGNGVIAVPGSLLVLRTGAPNRFPTRRRIRNVYRGASSLVARVFLVQPDFHRVQAVRDEIDAREGRVSLSTVSKVLKVLEQHRVIRRDGRASTLVDPGELLDRLARAYEPPRTIERRTYRWTGAIDVLSRLVADASPATVRTGAGSVDRHAVMPRERTLQCYCPDPETIERSLGPRLEPSSRFPDLELIQTDDPIVLFDRRTADGVAAASPVQTWLELQAGDERQRDAAQVLRDRMLASLSGRGGAVS